MTGLLFSFILLFAPPQAAEKPLPDLSAMKGVIDPIIGTLGELGEKVQDSSAPGQILREFTYTEKETVTSLDSRSKPKKSETRTYHVIQGTADWQYYRKLIAVGDHHLGGKELEEQDLKQQKREEKGRLQAERLALEAARQAAKTRGSNPPAPSLTPEQRKELFENAVLRYYSAVYDIRVARRDVLDGHSTVLLTFRPKPGVKGEDSFRKMLHNLSIDAWVTESGREVARLEALVVDTMSMGFGVLARFHKGSSLAVERRPISGNTWAPVKMEAVLSARILLLKGLHRKLTVEFSDFRRYSVETLLKVGNPDL